VFVNLFIHYTMHLSFRQLYVISFFLFIVPGLTGGKMSSSEAVCIIIVIVSSSFPPLTPIYHLTGVHDSFTK